MDGMNMISCAVLQVGVPTDGTPMVLDMATSAIAYYELVDLARRGRPCPSDVGYDAAGRETTEPAAILDGGAIRPFDRHAPWLLTRCRIC